MEIKKCNEKDIVPVGVFYDTVVEFLDEHINYPKWEYKIYPSENSVRTRTQEGYQFVCIDNDEIIGAFVLNDDPQGAYENASWSAEIPQGEYMVCHTLASHPYKAGQGIGKCMVEFCLRFAKEHYYKAVRLDVVPDNVPARKLYEKCGFQYVGDVDLERDIPEIPVFSMYEINL